MVLFYNSNFEEKRIFLTARTSSKALCAPKVLIKQGLVDRGLINVLEMCHQRSVKQEVDFTEYFEQRKKSANQTSIDCSSEENSSTAFLKVAQ